MLVLYHASTIRPLWSKGMASHDGTLYSCTVSEQTHCSLIVSRSKIISRSSSQRRGSTWHTSSACAVLIANPVSRLIATNATPTTLRSFVIFRLLWVSKGGSSAKRHYPREPLSCPERQLKN